MPTVTLITPQIPQNTGNIGRLCAATNTPLHLVGQLGFSLSDKYLKRSGLDYWQYLNWHHYPDTQDYINKLNPETTFLLSTKATTPYTEANIPQNATLLFGAEDKGLPEEIHQKFPNNRLKIPLLNPNIRSLNLANSVAIILYHVLEKNNALRNT